MAMKIIDAFSVCTDCVLEIETDEVGEDKENRAERQDWIEKHPNVHLYRKPVPKKFDNWEQLDAMVEATKVGKRWKRRLFERHNAGELTGELKRWMDRYAGTRLSLLRDSDFESEEPHFAFMSHADRDGCFGFRVRHVCECCGTNLGGDRHCIIQLGEA